MALKAQLDHVAQLGIKVLSRFLVLLARAEKLAKRVLRDRKDLLVTREQLGQKETLETLERQVKLLLALREPGETLDRTEPLVR